MILAQVVHNTQIWLTVCHSSSCYQWIQWRVPLECPLPCPRVFFLGLLSMPSFWFSTWSWCTTTDNGEISATRNGGCILWSFFSYLVSNGRRLGLDLLFSTIIARSSTRFTPSRLTRHPPIPPSTFHLLASGLVARVDCHCRSPGFAEALDILINNG